jgi:hypothetical protein
MSPPTTYSYVPIVDIRARRNLQEFPIHRNPLLREYLPRILSDRFEVFSSKCEYRRSCAGKADSQ